MKSDNPFDSEYKNSFGGVRRRAYNLDSMYGMVSKVVDSLGVGEVARTEFEASKLPSVRATVCTVAKYSGVKISVRKSADGSIWFKRVE